VEQAADQPALPQCPPCPQGPACVHELRGEFLQCLPDLLPIHPQPLGEARLELYRLPLRVERHSLALPGVQEQLDRVRV